MYIYAHTYTCMCKACKILQCLQQLPSDSMQDLHVDNLAVDTAPSDLGSVSVQCVETIARAPCSVIVYTWALKRLPYHYFGVYVKTRRVYGA